MALAGAPSVKTLSKQLITCSFFCPFNTSLWAEMLRLLKISLRWEGQGLLEAWQRWWNEATNDRERSIPLLVTWGTWLDRNQVIFKDSVFPIG